MVYDELDLPWTGLRIKPQGSAAGHNGIESVIAQPGDDEIVRGCGWGSIRATRCAAGWIICWRRSSARSGRNWRNWWPMRPTRLSP